MWKDHEIWYSVWCTSTKLEGNWQWSSFKKSNNNKSERAIAINQTGLKICYFEYQAVWYSQPPSYRELKDYDGQLNVDVKAQKSIHFVSWYGL